MVFVDVVYFFGFIGLNDMYGKYAHWPAEIGMRGGLDVLPRDQGDGLCANHGLMKFKGAKVGVFELGSMGFGVFWNKGLKTSLLLLLLKANLNNWCCK